MSSRFDYVKYNDRSREKQEEFKRLFLMLEDFTEKSLSSGRPKSLVMTKLEEAYMWVGKSIRDEQAIPVLQEQRNNS